MDGILLAIIAILWLVAIFVNNTRYGRARNLRGFSRHVPLPLTDAVATAIPRRLLRESVGAALGCVPALLVAFAMTIWSPELLNGASGSTIFPAITGLTTTYVASGLNATGTPSVDFFPFLLAITVLQAILQLSRPGARYRRRLWPALVTQI
jgi:hypothetical protein